MNERVLQKTVAKISSRSHIEDVILRGYADSQGTEHFNVKLSKMRAFEVSNYLSENGVLLPLINIGNGSIPSRIPNQPRNRRVDVVLKIGS